MNTSVENNAAEPSSLQKEAAGVSEQTDATLFSTVKDGISRKLKTLLNVGREESDVSNVEWDESDEYDFNHPHRGTAIIFNMETVKDSTDDIKQRDGTEVDAEKMQETLSYLGFDVKYYENKTKKEMMTILKKESNKDHSKVDCFACVILTHGGTQYYTADGWHKRVDRIMAADTHVFTHDIVDLFIDDKCKSLKGKPKLFFVQACRGDEFDRGVYKTVSCNEVDAKPVNSIEYTPCPIYNDFLIMYATPPGFSAFRHPVNGSWFIQGLCKVLSSPDDLNKKSLHQLLTTAIRVVSYEYEAQGRTVLGHKQCPCFLSMLVKDVYFRPKTKNNLV